MDRPRGGKGRRPTSTIVIGLCPSKSHGRLKARGRNGYKRTDLKGGPKDRGTQEPRGIEGSKRRTGGLERKENEDESREKKGSLKLVKKAGVNFTKNQTIGRGGDRHRMGEVGPPKEEDPKAERKGAESETGTYASEEKKGTGKKREGEHTTPMFK